MARTEYPVDTLVEGNSIRATVRMTGIAKNTVAKLLVDLGAACSKYQDETLRDIKSSRVQCDQIWAFVGAKTKNATDEKKGTRLGRLLDLDRLGRGLETDDLVEGRPA